MENGEKNMEETLRLEQKPRGGFNMGQVALAICVIIALMLAGWNAFSIMETGKEMRGEDAELSDDIGALNASINTLDNEMDGRLGVLNASINALDNEMDGRLGVLSNEISDVDNRLTEEKNALLDILNRLNETLQGKIDSLQNRVGVIEGDITEIDIEIYSMQTDIQSLQDQLDALKSRVMVLEQANDFDGDGILDRYDTDDDNDGIPDTDDAFPNNATEWKDNDNDGIGDNADPDDDNDGYFDIEDVLPYKDAVIKITVISFTLEDTNDDIFFEIYVNWDPYHILRSPVFWDCPNGWQYTVNWACEFNVPDNAELVAVLINMYDEDIDAANDYLDIEGKSSSYSLYLTYNIVTQTWSGDDDDGYSSGFEDGRSGESDVLFNYNIELV